MQIQVPNPNYYLSTRKFLTIDGTVNAVAMFCLDARGAEQLAEQTGAEESVHDRELSEGPCAGPQPTRGPSEPAHRVRGARTGHVAAAGPRAVQRRPRPGRGPGVHGDPEQRGSATAV